MGEDYRKYHPKPRTGNECKKTDCVRYRAYIAWCCGDSGLNYCMNCRNAHISQYEKKATP